MSRNYELRLLLFIKDFKKFYRKKIMVAKEFFVIFFLTILILFGYNMHKSL
jgi:hypothetical protein